MNVLITALLVLNVALNLVTLALVRRLTAR